MAMLDELQWHHPLVQHHSAITDSPHTHRPSNCTVDPSGQRHCVPGCPGTKLRRTVASGYNADTCHFAEKLLYGMYLNTPFQAAPVRLENRVVPPLWGGVLGWSYTFGLCPSNFLDCAFLDHSPCPRIAIDIELGPGNALTDRSRWSGMDERLPDSVSWYHTAVGYWTDTPKETVQGFVGSPALQAAYAYLYRPRYFLRAEVSRRVDAFGMTPGTCALMHVRRGDIGAWWVRLDLRREGHLHQLVLPGAQEWHMQKFAYV